ncbi:MAG: TGS domain-containing protein, partial [Candidatus Diapherotrites archaeon]|nr:TGS domain-containing protein [Candidatus Diapherotrites archaeon]
QGKGLGNQFLNDLMQAKALIHVLDASGSIDSEGNLVEAGSHDPAEDVIFLEKEIAYWIKQILTKNWQKLTRQVASTKKPIDAIATQLSGLGITPQNVQQIFDAEKFSAEIQKWNEQTILDFASSIVKHAKPILIAANKIDVDPARENLKKLQKQFPEKIFVACFAEGELALRKAARQGLINYLPGSTDFEIVKQLSDEQKKALEFIREKMQEFNGTGVQEALNAVAFELLKLIFVYPVEDALHWTDSKGNILPDALLVENNTTPLELAEKIHSSFRERFIAAIDARTKQKLAKDYNLKMNDVIKIQLSK